MKKKNKPTAKDIEFFKRQVDKWIDVYGMYDWRLYKESKELGNLVASNCDVSIQDRVASISLASCDWITEEISKDNLDRYALHEVLELLFIRIRSMAEQAINPVLVDEEIHSIIARIENAFKRGRIKA